MRDINGKAVLTTGQVASICHVAPRTVSKWFDTGELRGYRIPGSRDRRIPVEHLRAFMRTHGIPMDALDGPTCRVLVIDPSGAEQIAEAFKDSDRYDVRAAANDFEAGVTAQEFRPHAIVVHVGDNVEEAVDTCRKIKATPPLQSVKVIAAGEAITVQQRKALIGQGFDECLAKPYSRRATIEAVDSATKTVS